MSRHSTKHGVRRSMVGSVAVLVVVALTGYLFVTNLRVNRTSTVSSDTAGLVEQRVNQVNTLQKEVNSLSNDVNTMTKLSTDDNQPSNKDDGGDASTVMPAVEGPGVSVTLNDSPMWKQAVDSSGSSVDIDKYVIHQQDIEAVINALWEGDAEYMQVMDQRVLFNSAVMCSGNVIPTIAIYKQYVSAFGLGWKVERKKDLHFDQCAKLLQPLKYAKVTGNGQESDSESAGADSTKGDTEQ